VNGTDGYPHMPILRRAPISPILGFWGSKVPRNVRFPAQNAMNHRAKFDAANFILAGDIRNRTNKQTNSKRYIDALPIGMCG